MGKTFLGGLWHEVFGDFEDVWKESWNTGVSVFSDGEGSYTVESSAVRTGSFGEAIQLLLGGGEEGEDGEVKSGGDDSGDNGDDGDGDGNGRGGKTAKRPSKVPGVFNSEGRLITEPPILNYEHMFNEEYVKKRGAVLRYFKGDVVKATAFLDINDEHDLLVEYVGWVDNQDSLRDPKSYEFFTNLRLELMIDMEVVTQEFDSHNMELRFGKREHGYYDDNPWVVHNFEDDGAESLLNTPSLTAQEEQSALSIPSGFDSVSVPSASSASEPHTPQTSEPATPPSEEEHILYFSKSPPTHLNLPPATLVTVKSKRTLIPKPTACHKLSKQRVASMSKLQNRR